MIKVMNCIVREQREFFDKGIAFLRPLTLAQVARQIDMHESTVSRVCSGKYVQTPRGVFELKFFFSSGLETDDGEDVSARTAKDIIKTLIDEEDKKDPLSDQRIAELLHEKGLQIARRTVAKYREQLQHPAGPVPPAGGLNLHRTSRIASILGSGRERRADQHHRPPLRNQPGRARSSRSSAWRSSRSTTTTSTEVHVIVSPGAKLAHAAEITLRVQRSRAGHHRAARRGRRRHRARRRPARGAAAPPQGQARERAAPRGPDKGANGAASRPGADDGRADGRGLRRA